MQKTVMQNTTLLRRIGAMIYDALLLFALLMLTSIPFIALRGGEAVPPLTDHFFRLSLAIVIYIFFVGFWMRSGRTLGMQSWRLQLESIDGSELKFAALNLRLFASLLSWAPAGLGFLWSLWDKDRLTWHDRISKTRIVHYPKDAS
jgi:uncharacterized RDD family membrane protein YckC